MKELKKYMIFGGIFVSVIGTIFHFVYEWSGNNIIVGIFAPINESIWEHTKLIFFPMLFYSIYLNKKTNQRCCVNPALIFGSLVGVLLIITLFYTYTGITGLISDLINISIFYISVIISFCVVYKTTMSCSVKKYESVLSIIQIVMICLYVLFTFAPPNIPLFISYFTNQGFGVKI